MANLNILLIILLCNFTGGSSMHPIPRYHEGSDSNDVVHDYSQPYSGYPHNHADDYQNYDFQGGQSNDLTVPVGPSSSTHHQHYYEGTSRAENGAVPRYHQPVLEGESQNNNPHHDVTDDEEPLIYDNEKGLPCINGYVVPLEVPPELYVVCGFIGSTTSPHTYNSHQKQEEVMETIERVMLASPFKHYYKIHLLNRWSWSTAGAHDADEKQRFLIRLCLMSTRFFMGIHHYQKNNEKLIDDILEQELSRMLSWLHGILIGTFDLSSPLNWIAGAIRKTVVEQTSVARLEHSFMSVTKKSNICPVTCSEAVETRSILFVLGNYCRSTNPVKWRQLFEKDVFFFKLLVNMTFNILDGHLSRNLNFQRQNPNFEFLPWEDDWNGALHNKRLMPFNFASPMSHKIKSRIDVKDRYGDRSWKDLISWESKGEILSKYLVTSSRSSDHS